MTEDPVYLLAADLLLIIHFSFVLFVTLGLMLIWAGKFRGWSWIRDPWFRLTHLTAVLVVVLQSWLGVRCPLTAWEMALREKGGQEVYSETFVSYWVGTFLYYQGPPWVFTLLYTLIGVVIFMSWLYVRPAPFSKIHR